MILIIEFYQNFFFLSFNHIFLYIIGAFDVFLFPFSLWNNNLSYTIISVTKLDDIKLVWRGYIQTMCYHTWVNPRHIFTVLGEHIFTLLEEMNNILLRLLFHTCSNSCELLQVGFVQGNIFYYFNQLNNCHSFFDTYRRQPFVHL